MLPYTIAQQKTLMMEQEELPPQPFESPANNQAVNMTDTDDDQTSNFKEVVPVHPSFLKKWGSLIVLSLALAIIIIDTTVLNVSLSTIIHELHTNIQSLQWVITVYALMLASLTITGGRLGDLFGRKKMFMAGAAIFAVGSFIASISPNVGTLLAGESVIEGIGAALMLPATASLLVASFQGRDRAIAFGIWGGIAAASSSIGPILGGFLTNEFSWRWAFRINVVVAALLLIGSVLIKESRDVEEKPKLDIVGVLLSAFGLLSVAWGVIESSTYGWFISKQDIALGAWSFNIFGVSITPIAILFGLLFLDLFYEWELHVDRVGGTPLVSMKIFHNRAFTAGVLTTGIMSLGMMGLIFTLPVYLQSVAHLDALHTGFAMAPMSAPMLIVAPLSGILSQRISPKRLIQAGLLLNAIAVLVMRQSFGVDASIISLAPGLILYGCGMGLVMAPISNLTLSAVSVQQAGEAAGVNNTVRQVGTTLGSSIIGAVLLSLIVSNVNTNIATSQVVPPAYKSRIEQVVTKQSTNIEFGSNALSSNVLPPKVAADVSAIIKQATVDSAKTAFLLVSLFALLGLLASISLPKAIAKHGQDISHGH